MIPPESMPYISRRPLLPAITRARPSNSSVGRELMKFTAPPIAFLP